MFIRLDKMKMDLGITPIENIFLNTYLQLATGDQIKLYLCLYHKAYQRHGEVDPDNLGEECGLSQEQIDEAMLYWMEQGLLRIAKSEDKDVYVLLSLRELSLGLVEPEEWAGEPVSNEVKENGENPVMTHKEMCRQIEEIIETHLTPTEMIRLMDFISEFNISKELVVEGYLYSSSERNKKNLNYVLSVLRNWALDGIRTVQDYQENNEKKQDTEKVQKKKTKAVGRAVKKDIRYSKDDLKSLLDQRRKEDFERARGENDE